MIVATVIVILDVAPEVIAALAALVLGGIAVALAVLWGKWLSRDKGRFR